MGEKQKCWKLFLGCHISFAIYKLTVKKQRKKIIEEKAIFPLFKKVERRGSEV